jgi:hypothetical protein
MATTLSQPAKIRADDAFFSGMAIVILGIVMLGFARTYYLAGTIHAPLPSATIHIHAVVFSSWILLLLAQTSLVTSGQVGWHRQLGVLGAVIVFMMIVLGVAAALDTQKRHTSIPGVQPAEILAVQFVELSVFAVLVAKGIAARRDAPAHKRLMLLSVICLMGPAISRWPFAVIASRPPLIGFVIDLLLLSLLAYDWLTRRKIHRVTIWGSLLIFIAVPLGFALSNIPAWHRFTEMVRQ